MKKTIVGFCLLMAQPSAEAALFKLGSVCPETSIPKPWAISDSAPDLAHNTSHFYASLSALGLKSQDAGDHAKNSEDVFVSLRKCPARGDEAYSLSPCGENEIMEDATNRGAGFKQTRKVIGELNIGYRRFWPRDRSYVGICDGIDYDSMKTNPRSICRIWIAHHSRQRGLYIVVPGQTFRLIPEIVAQARIFLDPRFKQCTI